MAAAAAAVQVSYCVTRTWSSNVPTTLMVIVTCLQAKPGRSGKPEWPSRRTRWRSWRRSSSRVTTQTSTPGSSWPLSWVSARAAYRWEAQLVDMLIQQLLAVSVLTCPHFTHSFVILIYVLIPYFTICEIKQVFIKSGSLMVSFNEPFSVPLLNSFHFSLFQWHQQIFSWYCFLFCSFNCAREVTETLWEQ